MAILRRRVSLSDTAARGWSVTTVSIVIPLFNKAKTLARCIESAVGQKHSHQAVPHRVEVVIVDDGSTDDGVMLLPRRLSEECRIISQEKSGVSAARNRGVRECVGDLILFLDADDELLPGAVELFLKMSRKYLSAGFFSGAHIKVSEDGQEYIPRGAWRRDRTEIVENFFLEYLRNAALINSSSVCIRRGVFVALGGFPEGQAMGEDVYMWFRLALHTPLCHTGRRVSRVYRNAPNRSPLLNKRDGRPPYFVDYYLNDENGSAIFRSNRHLRLATVYLASLNLFGARETGANCRAQRIVESFRSYPLFFLLLLLLKYVPVAWVKFARKLVARKEA